MNPTVYHGTPRAFPMVEGKVGRGDYGPGMYFTTLRAEAERYAGKGFSAGRVFSCDIEFKKPIEFHRVFIPADIEESTGLDPLELADIAEWHRQNGLGERLGGALWEVVGGASTGGVAGTIGGDDPARAIAKLTRGGYDGIIVHLRESSKPSEFAHMAKMLGVGAPPPPLEPVSAPALADRTYYIVFDPSSIECLSATPNRATR